MQWPRAHLRVRECWFRSRLQWVGAWQIFTISVVPHTATGLWPLLAAVSPSHVFVPQPATLWYPALMRLGLMGTVLVCHIPLCLPRVGFSAGLARWIRSFFFRHDGALAGDCAVVGGGGLSAAARRSDVGRRVPAANAGDDRSRTRHADEQCGCP